jgi:superfamily II DNA or RNA helicase
MIKEFARTGTSTTTNSLGMREMQQRAYEARDNQYILIKAPPASGKSRALMFLALHKVKKQKLKKVIVAVPERSIGASFAETKLTEFGFYSDWNPDVNLCTSGSSSASTVDTLLDFLKSDQTYLICTHATLRFAFKKSESSDFNDCLLAIDEFHHVSVSEDNILGDTLRQIMASSNAHIIAMTGSYFRGDSNAVLMPEDEAKFYPVTYTYYEQLNNYKYLKTLGIGHHFYQGRYISAIDEVLDTDKKTIVHIPNVNSAESTKDKHEEVGQIIDIIGTQTHICANGIRHVKRHSDGKVLKIADLVEDSDKERQLVTNYLRENKEIDDLDIIIALGMAKEGFDWPWCEHSLTVGYRRSLQEVVQIIGRCTRDSSNKDHAKFTNLLALPIAADEKVHTAVNNVLKAVACSLLMEQVLAPVFKFKTNAGEPKIKGFKLPPSEKAQQIVDSDLNELKVKILEDPEIVAAANGAVDPITMNKDLVAKVVRKTYPDLDEEEVEAVRQAVVVDTAIKAKGQTNSEAKGSMDFIKIGDKLILVEELDIDMIDSINPFQEAYEVLSHDLSKEAFKQIQDHLASTRIKVTEEECTRMMPIILSFLEKNRREPSQTSNDPLEVRMYECLVFARAEKARRAKSE